MMMREYVYGMVAVRRAQMKAVKHGWKVEIIENANGCSGCYARTDAIITRPERDTEREVRKAKEAERQASEERVQAAAANEAIPAALLRDVRPPSNKYPNGTVALDVLHRLGLVADAEAYRQSGRVAKQLWSRSRPQSNCCPIVIPLYMVLQVNYGLELTDTEAGELIEIMRER